jgi:hypothetical protein
LSQIDLPLVNQFLLQKQHLEPSSKIDDVLQISRDISGLHATGPTTPYLSLFARSNTFLRQNLEDELYVKKRLGRIRCMRGTLYVLTKEMIPIAYAATRRIRMRGFTDFLTFRGVSTGQYDETSSSILDILKGREMTSSEIKEKLKTSANVSAIVEQMCERGLLIRSGSRKGWKDRVNKYSIFHDVFPDLDLAKMDEADAKALLVWHYIRSFGPATENDIAWWIGINRNDARAALDNLQAQIEQVRISNLASEHILLKSDVKNLKDSKLPRSRSVNLLPNLDPYLMGYKDRERYLPQEYRDKVFDRGGNVTNTILLDGRVAGVWDLAEEKKPILKILLFARVEGSALKQIYLEAKRIGIFMVGNEVEVRECGSMIPLTRKTAGGLCLP